MSKATNFVKLNFLTNGAYGNAPYLNYSRAAFQSRQNYFEITFSGKWLPPKSVILTERSGGRISADILISRSLAWQYRIASLIILTTDEHG
jgi:hypothetical protein